ncbi:hypothetical protein P8452_05994 [Trifolium repens]|nr:hypothetical protein QL285_048486 [Trifolium repens]WJX15897.1 hypothetical protein P8452_05994 [Trifolium repens]
MSDDLLEMCFFVGQGAFHAKGYTSLKDLDLTLLPAYTRDSDSVESVRILNDTNTPSLSEEAMQAFRTV